MSRKSNYLNLFYDREADVLYFSKGIPSSNDISDEASDEVVIRRDPKTSEVTGVTIVNFSKKHKNSKVGMQLPVEVQFSQM